MASAIGTVDDLIGFYGHQSTAIQFASNADGTDTIDATAGTIADDTAVTLAFYWDGVDTVTYYINGTSAGTINTTDDDINQDEGMAVAFVIDNQKAASAEVIEVDYIKVVAER